MSAAKMVNWWPSHKSVNLWLISVRSFFDDVRRQQLGIRCRSWNLWNFTKFCEILSEEILKTELANPEANCGKFWIRNSTAFYRNSPLFTKGQKIAFLQALLESNHLFTSKKNRRKNRIVYNWFHQVIVLVPWPSTKQLIVRKNRELCRKVFFWQPTSPKQLKPKKAQSQAQLLRNELSFTTLFDANNTCLKKSGIVSGRDLKNNELQNICFEISKKLIFQTFFNGCQKIMPPHTSTSLFRQCVETMRN